MVGHSRRSNTCGRNPRSRPEPGWSLLWRNCRRGQPAWRPRREHEDGMRGRAEPVEPALGERVPQRVSIDGSVRRRALPAKQLAPFDVPGDVGAPRVPERSGFALPARHQAYRHAGSGAAGGNDRDPRLQAHPPVPQESRLKECAIAAAGQRERDVARHAWQSKGPRRLHLPPGGATASAGTSGARSGDAPGAARQ
jgi:hypothetical protein